MTRGGRARVGYDFVPLPRVRHPGWGVLRHILARSVYSELFALAYGQQGGGGDLVAWSGSDWRVSVCRSLCIDGPHRGNWAKALDEAARAGLIEVGPSYIRVAFHPPSTTDLPPIHHRSTADLPPIHHRSTPDLPPIYPRSTPDLPEIYSDISTGNHGTSVLQKEEKEEREEKRSTPTRQGAITCDRFERPPVPPEPAGLAPPDVSPIREPWLVVWRVAERLRGFPALGLGHPGREEPACRSISDAAAVEAGGSSGEAYERAVERLVGAWLADPWINKLEPSERPGLGNLASNLRRYARRTPRTCRPPKLGVLGEQTQAWLASLSPADRQDWEARHGTASGTGTEGR